MHLAPLIRDLAVITIVAGLVTLIFRRIRQPVVLGYIVAGIIVGPHTPPKPLVTDLPNVRILAELGVIFLMFYLGLEFSFRKLARVGAAASFAAIFEVVSMLGLGFAAGRYSGWSVTDSIFLGAILSISSTTIIIKALDELGLKARRFAELIFGILIVEDLIAILLLAALTTIATTGEVSALTLAAAAGKLGLVVGCWVLAGYLVVPKFINFVGKMKSDEMMILVSVGLCLFLVVLASQFQYSAALGAFIMGSILAESTESRRIENLMAPLRDLFAAIFFVSVGMLMNPSTIWTYKWQILFITAITIVGKIVSTVAGSLIAGQRLQTSVLVGFSLAQIGEFSFIIATLGLTLGVMSPFLYPVAVAVSLITTFTTPYFIKHSIRFSRWLEKIMPERARIALEKYAVWRERQSFRGGRGADFNRRAMRWALSGFVVTAANVIVATYALPHLVDYLDSAAWAYTASWTIATLISAPFIWSMASSFEGYERRTGAAAVLSQLLAVAWIGVLSLAFFPAKYVGLATLLIGGFLFTRLYHRLEASYRWFERGFLDTFKEHEKTKRPLDVYRRLAPWDGHLVRLKVHSDSEVAGRKLQDLELRKLYGLNIVAIQRGSRAIVSPKPDQQIFPKDELLALGTDEQIERARPLIESSPAGPSQPISIEGYELRALFVSAASQLRGRTIRDSRLREDFSAMVVGVERSDRRMMNPDTDLSISEGDTLWIVGESHALDALQQQMTPADLDGPKTAR